MTKPHLRASLYVFSAALFAAATVSAQETAALCGTARPELESITNAEGLVIAPDGTIYFSQPFSGDNANFLGRFQPPYDKPVEARWVDLGGDALGIMHDPERGVLYAGSRTRAEVLEISLSEPPVVSVLAQAEGGINGVTLGEDRAVYYNDQASGHAFRVAPDGTKTRVTTAPIEEPNGLAFGPDGKLYVVSWETPLVTRLTLEGGVEVARDVLATLPTAKADGIAFDAEGRIYVTADAILHQIDTEGHVTVLGPAAGANIDFGVGSLNCSDIYTAGFQGMRRFDHDTPGLDVPWHRSIQ